MCEKLTCNLLLPSITSLSNFCFEVRSSSHLFKEVMFLLLLSSTMTLVFDSQTTTSSDKRKVKRKEASNLEKGFIIDIPLVINLLCNLLIFRVNRKKSCYSSFCMTFSSLPLMTLFPGKKMNAGGRVRRGIQTRLTTSGSAHQIYH